LGASTWSDGVVRTDAAISVVFSTKKISVPRHLGHQPPSVETWRLPCPSGNERTKISSVPVSSDM
jgi:hypothetical protein